MLPGVILLQEVRLLDEEFLKTTVTYLEILQGRCTPPGKLQSSCILIDDQDEDARRPIEAELRFSGGGIEGGGGLL
jgi:hypothetical protein